VLATLAAAGDRGRPSSLHGHRQLPPCPPGALRAAGPQGCVCGSAARRRAFNLFEPISAPATELRGEAPGSGTTPISGPRGLGWHAPTRLAASPPHRPPDDSARRPDTQRGVASCSAAAPSQAPRGCASSRCRSGSDPLTVPDRRFSRSGSVVWCRPRARRRGDQRGRHAVTSLGSRPFHTIRRATSAILRLRLLG
jgi:hypothetical protein